MIRKFFLACVLLVSALFGAPMRAELAVHPEQVVRIDRELDAFLRAKPQEKASFRRYAQLGQIPAWPPVQPNIIATFGIDGSNQASATASSNPVTLTTSKGSGVIVIAIISNATSVSSVTAIGLTFSSRASVCSGSNCTFHWTAPYTTNFSGTITVVVGSSAFTTVCAFGIGASKTSSYFDPNGSLPGTGAPPTISTTNPNDFIFVNSIPAGAGGGPYTPHTGFTVIPNCNGSFQLAEYQIVTSTQSGLTPGGAGPPFAEATMDAIEKGP